MKNTKDKLILNLKKIDFLYILFVIISCMYTLLRVKKIVVAIVCILGILLLSTIFYFVLKKMLSKKVKLEYIYLVFALIIGSLFITFLPATQNPDSSADYLRSLEISEFHLTTPKNKNGITVRNTGRKFSSNISKLYVTENAEGYKYSDFFKLAKLKFNDEIVQYTYPTKALYAFVCYIPQAIGVGIGRLLNLTIYMQTIFGKICNYLFFVALIFLSIKFIPVKKELVLFISLIPMVIQEAASLSPDSMTIATSICFVSFITYFRHGNTEFSNKYKTMLFIISILLSMCKIVYLPICFLIFLIPTSKYKSKKEKYIYCILLSLIVIVCNLSWLKFSSDYLVAFAHRSDSSLQLKNILHNPIKYCFVILNTIDHYSIDWFVQLFGLNLGRYRVRTFSLFVMISLVITIRYVIKNDFKNVKKYIFNNLEKAFIGLITLGVIGLIFTSLYMQWTAPYNTVVEGIQGRYFIPLILLISMLFMTEEREEKNKNLIVYLIFINIMSVVAIIGAFL